jgi:hypothetical protein
MVGNLTFCGGEPWWANACVGENGNPDYYDYAKGYSAAANLLIVAVLSDEGVKHSPDQFIYPICFNMRHSVELRLKGVVVSLKRISNRRVILSDFDLKGSHDIGKIWAYIKRESCRLDGRYEFFVGLLDCYILDIASIDATGQTFRYPDDVDNVKHLVDVGSINVVNLMERFSKLELLLDSFESFNDVLREEYSLGTYTKNLSRSDLLDLASRLPAKSTWADIDFGVVKDNEKERLGIGSKEFCDAVNIIKNNYQLSALIGEKRALRYVNLEDLCAFFDAWGKRHGFEKIKNRRSVAERLGLGDVSGLERVFERIKELVVVDAEIWGELNSKITVDKLSDLKALFYCSRESYSEYYILQCSSYREELSALSSLGQPALFREEFFHLLRKTSVFDSVIRSLFMLGCGFEAEHLISRYEVDGCFSWLNQARSGELFIEPYRRVFSNCVDVLAA